LAGLCDSVQKHRRAFAASGRTFVLHKMQGIFLFVEELLAPEDGLCCMGTVK